MEEIITRKCVEKDFPEVYILMKQLMPDKQFNEKKLVEVFNQNLANPDKYFLCAVLGNRIIGFCSLVINHSLAFEGIFGYISELIVEKTYRRKNIGTILINEAKNQAKFRGCDRLDLDSALHREEAHIFYEKIGFTRTAVHFTLRLR